MNAKRILRIIALLMFAAAVIFFYIAINVPTMGHVFYIGSFKVDVYVKHIFYKSYLAVMAGLFSLSCFIGNRKT